MRWRYNVATPQRWYFVEIIPCCTLSSYQQETIGNVFLCLLFVATTAIMAIGAGSGSSGYSYQPNDNRQAAYGVASVCLQFSLQRHENCFSSSVVL